MWRLILAALLLSVSLAVNSAPFSVGFFYGPNPPWPELAQFDWVVLEPAYATPEGLESLARDRVQAFAYLSVGESLEAENIETAWQLGRNQAWSSRVMDVAHPGWQNALLARAHALRKQGFQGLFLDTLDSYQLLPEQQRAQQEQGLRELLQRFHQELPDLTLFFNRGFEVLDGLGWQPGAVAAESLYAGWDPATKSYKPVSSADRDWLRARLDAVRARDIPVVVIDYVPPERHDEARALARRVSAEGFIPWISVPAMDYVGISTVEVLPRRIAVIFDPREGEMTTSPAHTRYGALFEYLGYRVDYFAPDQLPDAATARGLYAGVLLWMSSGPPVNAGRFEQWLLQMKTQGVPLAFLGSMPIAQRSTLNALGLEMTPLPPALDEPVTFVVQPGAPLGFEVPLSFRKRDWVPLRSDPAKVVSWLELASDKGQRWAVAGVADWGGYAMRPYVLEGEGIEGRYRWVLDPFTFVQRALRLRAQPIVDSTTENGRRIATVHMDGDGFISRAEVPGAPFSGQLILDQFIRRYPLLSTVSVIEGEVGSQGVHPELSPLVEPIARAIFVEPRVEAANHSFSHPFYWQPEKAAPRASFRTEYGLHLDIPGYTFNLEREILGAQDYINAQLLPPNKRVKVMFWSGDALPDEVALRMAYRAGMDNINGGMTRPTNAFPSLTEIHPQMRPLNGVLQFYAPIMNENVYTNLWNGPYYGFRGVLETFRLTDLPRRMRPLSLYYHFYAGTKPASVEVLHQIYREIVAQKPLSLWISEYLQRQKGMYYASLGLRQDGGYQLRSLRGLRTVRLPPELGWPDMARSIGVAGVRDLPQGRYVHLSDGRATLYTRADPDSQLTLVQANTPLQGWQREAPNRVRVGFAGQFPLEFSVSAAGTCRLQVGGQWLGARREGRLQVFALANKQVGNALLECP